MINGCHIRIIDFTKTKRKGITNKTVSISLKFTIAVIRRIRFDISNYSVSYVLTYILLTTDYCSINSILILNSNVQQN